MLAEKVEIEGVFEEENSSGYLLLILVDASWMAPQVGW